jgi:DNA-binding transcriptional MerR regulator
MMFPEIAETSGLLVRTIRFYIARGLLNGPAKFYM